MESLAMALASAWDILKDSAVFMIAGFAVAGLIKVFLPFSAVRGRLSGGGMGPVARAAIIGVPLPLCSCSVLPTAMTLRKMGASRGATSAFLISTPESGVDSIAVSYALLDPIMTVFRPLSAFLTAFTAGALENLFGLKDEGPTADTGNDNAHADDDCGDCCQAAPTPANEINGEPGFTAKIWEGLRYAFGDLFDDMAVWMAAGLLAAGAMNVFIPEDFFTGRFHGGIMTMFLMLAVGLPMYICASASTPIAAAMIVKGLSPGAALVFLLAGPATNIGSMAIIRRFMGGRALFIYILAISVCSIALGLALDGLYSAMGVNPAMSMGVAGEIVPPGIKTAGALALAFLFARLAAASGFSAVSAILRR
jgi:hypothetical protein